MNNEKKVDCGLSSLTDAKPNVSRRVSFVERLICKMFGHKYAPDVWYSDNMQKIKCTRCLKKFGINHDVRLVLEWDAELEAFAKLMYPEKFEVPSHGG